LESLFRILLCSGSFFSFGVCPGCASCTGGTCSKLEFPERVLRESKGVISCLGHSSLGFLR
jgi:hypothetical protein